MRRGRVERTRGSQSRDKRAAGAVGASELFSKSDEKRQVRRHPPTKERNDKDTLEGRISCVCKSEEITDPGARHMPAFPRARVEQMEENRSLAMQPREDDRFSADDFCATRGSR